MGCIRLRTEQTREAGRRFLAEGDRLAEIGHELQRAIGSLDTWAWHGASRWRAESLLAQVRPQSANVAGGLDELGRKLLRVADVFETEDATAAQNLAGMPWVDWDERGQAGVDWIGPLRWGSRLVDRYGEWVEGGYDLLQGWHVATSLGRGLTYPGEVIFYGSHGAKEAIGLSPYLTHIKDVNIPAHMAGQAFRDGFSRGNFLLEGISELDENWDEYGGNIPKVAVGVVADTLLGVGVSAVFAAGGTAAGATFGMMIGGPVGAVIGGKIGGIAGGLLGGEAAEWLEDAHIGGRELDQIVVDGVTGAIGAGVEAVDRGLDSFVDGVASLFS